ncbi:MAG: glutaredoxin family protein [Actinobacteria bacterium]|jgi:glutaredoxin|nr:glutaredoxin family protein [Actinomycetota bacterium]
MPDPIPHSDARVTVVTKPGCGLCADAVATVKAVCESEGVTWVEVDASDQPELADAYYYEIPVIFVGGQRHDYHRVNPDRLRAALRA